MGRVGRAEVVGDDHRLDPVAQPQLGEHMADMRLHGRLAHEEIRGSYGVPALSRRVAGYSPSMSDLAPLSIDDVERSLTARFEGFADGSRRTKGTSRWYRSGVLLVDLEEEGGGRMSFLKKPRFSLPLRRNPICGAGFAKGNCMSISVRS